MARILKSFDTYRDGGSISVSYECDDLFCTCVLLFNIDWDSLDFEGGSYVRRFQDASLAEHHTFQWTSKITGATYDDTFQCEHPISWEMAREILSELAWQARELKPVEQQIFEEMIQVADSEGIGRSVGATN